MPLLPSHRPTTFLTLLRLPADLPAVIHTDESISTCKFAQRVAQVKNEVSVNEVIDHAALIARLKEENRALRESGGLADDDGSKRLSAEELAALHSEVRTFLSADDPEATIQWGKGKRAARVRHKRLTHSARPPTASSAQQSPLTAARHPVCSSSGPTRLVDSQGPAT